MFKVGNRVKVRPGNAFKGEGEVTETFEDNSGQGVIVGGIAFNESEVMYADDHSHVTDMPSPEADALNRIAELVREGVWERYETGKRPWTFQGAVSDILRETGRL